jgi:alpha-galactosidase
MNSLRAIPALVVSGLLLCQAAYSQTTTVDELSEARRWVASKFEGQAPAQEDHGYLLPHLKSGVLEKNSRQGHKLRIADQLFATGINCPSVGTVNVHLPIPARRFTAWIGVDSNDVTYYSGGGRGNVVVAVNANDKEGFRSPILHEGLPAIFVDITLGETQDFILQVSAQEPGTEWDEVDFAEAKVTLADGKEMELEELPIAPIRAIYTSNPPFSFVYGSMKSADLLRDWTVQRSSRELDSKRTEHTQTYRDPKTNLEVRCVGVEYHDFATVEWTVYFKNEGAADTPILENIQALDTHLERNGDGEFVLHHNKGAPATPNDYEPYETLLEKNSQQRFSGKGGRPSNQDLPYFNLAWPGQGTIIVVGWPGQWAGILTRDATNGVQVRIGQELTHFKLLPGEEVRTPRIVMQFWKGSWIRSQNIWRRWMEAYNMPHPHGQLPPPQMAGNTSREYVEMTQATDRDENMFIDRYVAEDLKPDYFWMDAGWYPNNGFWANTGTWEVDTTRFPQGLKVVSDHAHSKGIRIILWFEPERVTKGSWLYEQHSEWLLTPPPNSGDQLYDKEWKLLDFGNPEALDWLTNHVDKLITEQGIDLYRQDFNMDPLNYWRANDAPDRQGITEIRYVTGFLAYWDELRRRHPDMLIDSCASGGRRNDVDSLLRAVPLTRSDYLLEAGEPVSQQMQTYGMALWIPFFGTGVSGEEPYVFRSQMTPGIITTWDLRRKDLDYNKLRTLVRQWRAVAPNYYGDVYPLIPYSLATDVWAAIQFDRPEVGEGFVEIFRRSRSPYENARLKLQGLEPEGRYRVENLDSRSNREYSGKELMDQGVEVQLAHAPGSALLSYTRLIARAESANQ